jgi:ABC-type Fe3+ transport system substrate-binding protein
MSSEETKYHRVYTGSEVNVQYLENLFKKANISFITKNNFQSALRAGFGATQGQVQLLVEKSHFEEAQKIADAAFSQEGGDLK